MPLIPIIAAVTPMIPSIIRGVESIFGAKKGKEKKEASVNMVATLIKQARESGLVKEDDVNALVVANLVETVLATMKAEGTLQESKDPQTVEAALQTPTTNSIPVTFKGVLIIPNA